MRKYLSLVFLFLSLICLTSCGKKDAFKLREKIGSYHVEQKITCYDLDGTYLDKQEGDIFYDSNKDISYTVTNGVLGYVKEYSTQDYDYTYDYSTNKWYREKATQSESGLSESIDYNDKNNYDYKDGVYTTKKSLDLGSVEYIKWYVEDGCLVLEYKNIFEDMYIITIMKYVELDDKTIDLELPTNYINR